MALGRALICEGNETVLGTNPNRTHDQPKPYLETAETVLDLYSDKGMFPFLLRGAHKKNSLKIDAFPFSNRTRNRTRTAADFCGVVSSGARLSGSVAPRRVARLLAPCKWLRWQCADPSLAPSLFVFRGLPTIYHHHKGLSVSKVCFKEAVHKLSEPKRTAK